MTSPDRKDAPEDTGETAVHSAHSARDDTDAPVDAGDVGFATDAVVQEPLDLWSEVTPPGDAPEDEDVVPAWGEPEVYAGDGPFAAPVDHASSPQDRFAEALRSDFAPRRWLPGAAQTEPETVDAEDFDQTPHPAGPPGVGVSRADTFATTVHRNRRQRSLVVKRRVPKANEPGSEQKTPGVGRNVPPSRGGTRRHYPKMWALLDDPEAAREAAKAAKPPPVPGTFFPVATRPAEAPQVADLDQMLFAMAEGLLVSETADGHAEVRVTLRDEYFAGTELRLVMTEEGLGAVLVPPDRETYWLLSGTMHELEARLTGRGLKLKTIEVREP